MKLVAQGGEMEKVEKFFLKKKIKSKKMGLFSSQALLYEQYKV